ncbi:MAG: 4'-phosphopantetheinyl transferase superfamily protein [Hydrogenophaga sp.]|uniref:4'-phosphopantetheinyl transferase family protein n=1 Tax=Hydrogenophaga sp. TaxID=1904254 RepID=UPI002AB8B56E|nr:4'-phosphopantetheinyl transferase superfamily protein [Hydrogenophaga sp.]MDZ4187849.1 4'-phosphopantetheinyl transferase superfamily protein [Hydrogenophaga sp.]
MTTQLWWVNPDAFQASPAALALLSEAERAQHQRYIPPQKRHEYLVTRVLVRTVLCRALGVAPQTLQFISNAWGRPALWPPAPLHFNVSHTEGLVVCLVSPDPDIGVDTERLARAPDLLALAPTVFAPQELRDLAVLPASEQAHRAVVLWTLKESYIKARGMGLALPLDGFAFRFDADRVRLEVSSALEDDGDRWQFHTQLLGSHCVSTCLAGFDRGVSLPLELAPPWTLHPFAL